MPEKSPLRTERFAEIPHQQLEEIYSNKTWKRVIEKQGLDPKKIAVFLHPEGELELRTIDFHHRSVDRVAKDTLVAPATEKVPGRAFCHFDIKGAGFINPETHASKKDSLEKGSLKGYPEAYIIAGSQETPWGYDALGLFDERMAVTSVKKAEELAALGMRTEEFVSLLRMNTLYLNGKATPVSALTTEASKRFLDDAKKITPHIQRLRQELAKAPPEAVVEKEKELLALLNERETLTRGARDVKKDFQPVIAIRLMRSVFRIRDLVDAESPDQARFMLEEAIDNLKKEAHTLGLDEPPFSLHEAKGREAFVEFLATWYGKNLGILMKNGQSHQFLHMGNLTLAGEVVDLDSVGKVIQLRQGKAYFSDGANNFRTLHPRFGIPNCLVKDIRDTVISIKKLLRAMKANGYAATKTASITESFVQGYTDGLGEHEPYLSINVSNQQLKTIAGTIAQEALDQGVKYPSIPVDGAQAGEED